MSAVWIMVVLTGVWVAGVTVFRRDLSELIRNVLYAATVPLMFGWYLAYTFNCASTVGCF